jgi:hypothetical protein
MNAERDFHSAEAGLEVLNPLESRAGHEVEGLDTPLEGIEYGRMHRQLPRVHLSPFLRRGTVPVGGMLPLAEGKSPRKKDPFPPNEPKAGRIRLPANFFEDFEQLQGVDHIRASPPSGNGLKVNSMVLTEVFRCGCQLRHETVLVSIPHRRPVPLPVSTEQVVLRVTPWEFEVLGISYIPLYSKLKFSPWGFNEDRIGSPKA